MKGKTAGQGAERNKDNAIGVVVQDTVAGKGWKAMDAMGPWE